MKKTIRILALVMVAATLCCMMVACGKKLSGKYALDTGKVGDFLGDLTNSSTTLEFSGSKVTISVTVFGKIYSETGKYTIDGNQITLDFDDEEDEIEDYDGTFTFEEGEDYIKIGAFGTFNKVN